MLLLYLMYMISELIRTEINHITHMLHLPFAVCVYIYIQANITDRCSG